MKRVAMPETLVDEVWFWTIIRECVDDRFSWDAENPHDCAEAGRIRTQVAADPTLLQDRDASGRTALHVVIDEQRIARKAAEISYGISRSVFSTMAPIPTRPTTKGSPRCSRRATETPSSF